MAGRAACPDVVLGALAPGPAQDQTETPTAPAALQRLRDRLPAVAPLASAVVGFGVLVGWLFDVAVLKGGHPSLVPVRPNLALFFILIGTALQLRRSGSANRWARIVATGCVALAALICAATWLEYLLGRDFGLDGLLVQPRPRDPEPLRMGVAAAVNGVLVSIGIPLIPLRTRAGQYPAQWLALVVIGIALVNGLGYLYGAAALASFGRYPPIALPSVATFLLLGLAILYAHPDDGLMRPLSSVEGSGLLARRMLPAAVSIPIVLGWFHLAGERGPQRSSPLTLSLYATANVICLLALVWGTAAAIDRHERQRRSSETTAQARLLLVDRMSSMGLLAAGITHQINNPLAVVIANLDLVLRELHKGAGKEEPPSEMKAELLDARDGAERVGQIVRDLNMFAGDPQTPALPVDVNAWLDTCLRLAGNRIHKHARVIRRYGRVPLVEANESGLGQVFLNLLVNAAEALPAGPAADNEMHLTTYLDERGRVAVELGDRQGSTFRITLAVAG
jgi:signal transduction histidine kinase